MFTRFMISLAFRGFSRRAIRIFSRSVIGVPWSASATVRVVQIVRNGCGRRSFSEVGLSSLRGVLWLRKRTSSAWLPRSVLCLPTAEVLDVREILDCQTCYHCFQLSNHDDPRRPRVERLAAASKGFSDRTDGAFIP